MSRQPIDTDRNISFVLNGRPTTVHADPAQRLIDVLREDLGLTGTKEGCGEGTCGSCTVLLEGRAVRSCVTPLGRVQGRTLQTIEGVGTREHLHPLQVAFIEQGAIQCGFCTPGTILSAKALLDQNPRPTRKEIVSALRGNLCRCTGYKKIVEAVEGAAETMASVAAAGGSGLDPAVAALDTTSASPTPAVGSSVHQPDVWDKALGRTLYGADVTPQHCAHLRVVRSTKPHARIISIDSARAFGTPGVLAVITAQDIRGTNRTGPFQRDRPVLADGKVRFAGEAVALVAAETPHAAARGAEAVRVDYEDLPVMSGPAEALALQAPPIHESGNLLAEWTIEKGDISSASADVAVVVEGTFETPFYEHAYLEPEAGVAWLENDRIVLRLSTQNPHEDQEEVAAALGLEPDRLRVMQAPTGGAFGGKTSYDPAALLALGALVLQRPVKLVYSRAESLSSTEKRHPFRMHLRMGANRDGLLQTLEADLTADTGAYASYGKGVAERAATHISGPYEIPHVLIHSRSVYTNSVPAGAMRGYGAPQASFATESLLDLLAAKLRLDPLEIRRRNAFQPGSVTATGQILEHSVGIGDTITALAPYYDEARSWAATPAGGGLMRGVGVASIFFGISESGRRTHSRIGVRLSAEGAVELLAGAPDLGQGVYSVLRQITADTLDLPLDCIEIITPDTDLMPSAGATEASRQTLVSGRAAAEAAAKLRQKLSGLGFTRTQASSCREYLRQAHAELTRRGCCPGEIGFHEPQIQPIDRAGRGTPHVAYSFASHLAQVEVDSTSKAIRVIRLVAAHDVGRPINPRALEGQIEGGIMMGMGMALSEEFVPGQTIRMADYKVPRIADMPEIVNIIVDGDCPEGPFGAKGVGEVPAVGPASAIANAVADATSSRPLRLPIRL